MECGHTWDVDVCGTWTYGGRGRSWDVDVGGMWTCVGLWMKTFKIMYYNRELREVVFTGARWGEMRGDQVTGAASCRTSCGAERRGAVLREQRGRPCMHLSELTLFYA